jgi:hypothetical protein
MAVLAALVMSLAMRPDSDSNPVMRFHLVTTWQRRSRSASVMSAQFHLGMGSQMRSGLGLGMGWHLEMGSAFRRLRHHHRRRRPQG